MVLGKRLFSFGIYRRAFLFLFFLSLQDTSRFRALYFCFHTLAMTAAPSPVVLEFFSKKVVLFLPYPMRVPLCTSVHQRRSSFFSLLVHFDKHTTFFLPSASRQNAPGLLSVFRQTLRRGTLLQKGALLPTEKVESLFPRFFLWSQGGEITGGLR